MPELLIDFITSLDGYAAADGWPGWWGLEGPEYLAWLGEQPEAEYTVLMGATTYRVMSGYAAEGEPGTGALAGLSKVAFSTTLSEPLSWPNTQLMARHAVETVREMKDKGSKSMRTIGSLTLCRSLLNAGLVDRFRVVCLSRHHRKQRPGTDLRRLSRCCSRHDQQPHVRWSHPTARVRCDDSGWAAGHHHGQRLTRITRRSETSTARCWVRPFRSAPPAGRPPKTTERGNMTTPAPTVTDHDDFERQLLELRKREKAHTREGDAIAAARRRLPMAEVPPDTTVIGPDGPVPFGDVFEGRDELVVYSHMFYDGEPWEWQCEGCTRNSWNMGDAADAAYLNANGITFAILGDGPYEEIAAFRDFMGYTAPWYSSAHLDDPTVGVAGRISCYLRREDKIYLTYWTTGRGDEVMSPSFGLLDMTAYGRREEWEDSPEGWPRFPTHSFLRTDEHGAPMGPRNGGRPVPQWTRPGVTGVGVQTG